MKQSNILKVGLTGGIGCGKSTISNMLKDKGISIVDADKIARKVLVSHPEILIKIKHKFGEEYFDEEGIFLRKKMGELIFSNKEKKREYEDLIMPYIFHDIFAQIDEYDKMGMDICIVDAPTLIETKLYKSMDFVIVISVMEDVQILRVMDRDGFTREEAIMRIKNQIPTSEKIKFADYIIDNGGTLEYTSFQLESILSSLKNKRGKNGL